MRGAGRCGGSALQSWKCGRAWGDGTRDLTGINYDTASRTSAEAYASRMTWDSDGPPGKRMCSHPGLPLGWRCTTLDNVAMSRQVRARAKLN